MKHFADTPQTISSTMVRSALEEIALPCTEAQAVTIAGHANLVVRTNADFNLTRITSTEAILRLHIQDSALALPLLLDAPDGGMLDMGTGPGYPGVVLSVLSGRHVVLADSVRKKVTFLERVVAELGLDAEAYWGRIEEIEAARRRTFAVVIARGLSALPAIVELAAPMLIHHGILIAMKGRIEEDEVRRGVSAGRQCGLEMLARTHRTLPGGETREIITFQRTATPRIALPRRTGMAQRQPLA
ncbi:MAG: 16S rRNA (guanine(527)-N(7))-methyltransferase RsmG [Coriobacteriia bacterium]